MGLAYPINTMGVTALSSRNSFTICKHCFKFIPFAKARSDALCITGPSAIGSENGIPNSIKSAPASTRACMIFTVSEGSGSPAVTKGIKPFFPDTFN